MDERERRGGITVKDRADKNLLAASGVELSVPGINNAYRTT